MVSNLPKVKVIGTGGSISAFGPTRVTFAGYSEYPTSRRYSAAEMVANIPEANEVAQIEAEQLNQKGSSGIGPDDWLLLSSRINEIFSTDQDVAGVVVTHGTSTLEETSYFLHLTVKSNKPVACTAAMRPPSAMGTDAEINLLDAIRLVCSLQAREMGVMTVLNNEIQCAREVTKNSNGRLETYHPNELGFLGYVDSDQEVVFYRKPTRRHTVSSEFDVSRIASLPRVDIVYAYAGGDGLIIESLLEKGVKNMVIAATGGGAMPQEMAEAAAEAVRFGAVVVLSSRAGSGRVIETPAKIRQGFIVSDNLLPQKARVLLMLALTVTRDHDRIRQIFREY